MKREYINRGVGVMGDKKLELGDLKALHTRLVRDLLTGHGIAS